MSSKMGPKTETNGLVFYIDTSNVHSYPGEPTTNITQNTAPGWHNSGYGIFTTNDTEISHIPFTNQNTPSLLVTDAGAMNAWTITSGLENTSNYQVNDRLWVDMVGKSNTLNRAYIRVSSVDGSGQITGTAAYHSGGQYTASQDIRFSNNYIQGGGTGAQFISGSITSVASTTSNHLGTAAYTNVVSGSTYTVSTYFYQTNGNFGQIYIRGSSNSKNYGYLEYNGSVNTSTWPHDEWIRISQTFTADGENSAVYISGYAGTVGIKVAYNGWQIEQKDHVTPFTYTSRPTTNGVKDLHSNLSFNISSSGFYDYTDQSAILTSLPTELQFSNQELTVAAFVNVLDNPNLYQGILCLGDSVDGVPRLNLAKARSGWNDGKFYWQLINESASGTHSNFNITGTEMTTNGYQYICGTLYLETTWKLQTFYNGILQNTNDTAITSYDLSVGTTPSIAINRIQTSTEKLVGYAPIIQVWNRRLSNEEILNNYNMIKKRFGL